MKVEFDSQESTIEVSVPFSGQVIGSASTSNLTTKSRGIAVSFLSTSEHVALSIKPSVLAQEERQERLTRTIRLGFPPASMSTKG